MVVQLVYLHREEKTHAAGSAGETPDTECRLQQNISIFEHRLPPDCCPNPIFVISSLSRHSALPPALMRLPELIQTARRPRRTESAKTCFRAKTLQVQQLDTSLFCKRIKTRLPCHKAESSLRH